jgi:hypothetical protein
LQGVLPFHNFFNGIADQACYVQPKEALETFPAAITTIIMIQQKQKRCIIGTGLTCIRKLFY